MKEDLLNMANAKVASLEIDNIDKDSKVDIIKVQTDSQEDSQ